MWRSKKHKRKVKKIGIFRTGKLKNMETKSDFRKAVEKMSAGRKREGDADETWQKLERGDVRTNKTRQKKSREIHGGGTRM